MEHRLDLEGHLVGHGSPYGLNDLPINRVAALVWWFMVKDADSTEREKFRAKLWVPPKTTDPIPVNSPWSAENEMAAFAAVKAATGA